MSIHALIPENIFGDAMFCFENLLLASLENAIFLDWCFGIVYEPCSNQSFIESNLLSFETVHSHSVSTIDAWGYYLGFNSFMRS